VDQVGPGPNAVDAFQAAVRAVELRDWPQAEALCRQVLLAVPGHVDALNVLGIVLSEAGRVQEAVRVLREAVDLQPSSAALWMNLGLTHSKLGEFAAAVECHSSAVRVQSDFGKGFYHLALAYRDLGQLDNAIIAMRRAAERILQLNPGSEAAIHEMARALRALGELEEAKVETVAHSVASAGDPAESPTDKAPALAQVPQH